MISNQAIVVSSGSECSDNESLSNSEQRKKGLNNPHFKNKTQSSSRVRSSRRRPSIPKSIKHYVEHDYHDHSQDPLQGEDEVDCDKQGALNTTSGPKKRRGGHRGGVAVPFPEKLHFMLSQMEQNESSHIVNWQPHGRCFVVHKPKEFVEEIMPRFFRQTKMTSFQRQLNLYGFSRLTTGPDRGGYYHELFIRGRLDLCKRMVRTRVKGNGSKAASSPSTEPNFYAMAPCHELDEDKEISYVHGELSETCEKTCNEGTPADFHVVQKDFEVGDPTIGAKCTSFPLVPRAQRSESWDSLPSLQTSFTSMLSSSSLPVVSPDNTRALISPPQSPRVMSLLAVPTAENDKDFIHIHSGDQVFFEGLPFHYLETKDIEDSLLCIGV